MTQPTLSSEPEDAREAARLLFRAGRYEQLAARELAPGAGGDGEAAILAARGLLFLDRLDEAESLLDRVSKSQPRLATAVAVERADLELRRYTDPAAILARLDDAVLPADDGLIRGRWLVVRATVLNRLQRSEDAASAAIGAVDVFTTAAAIDERARALDMLGTILSWQGDIEQASLRFSLALADWATVGNVAETAATIANLGRLNLEARRHGHAVDFLRRARELSPHDAASRTGLRLRHNVAQALSGLDRFAEARAMLVEAAGDARAAGIAYLEFICLRDAAVAAARQGETPAADELLARAAALVAEQEPGSYDSVSLLLARAAVAAAADAADALGILESAAAAVAGRGLGPPEIDNLRLLARVLARRGDVRSAERHLTMALRLAMARGLSWHRRETRMDLARLRSAEGSILEADRPIHLAASGGEAGGLPERGYLLRERIGSGGFGEVHRAYDLDNAREVAIKRLSFAGRYDVEKAATIIASVERELDAASRVEHPGVARVYGLNRDGAGNFHLVQEYVAGPSLRARMEAEPRPDPAAVAQVAVCIAQALSAIHRAGVIHRDLKPENVILRNGRDPVIIDFGIAHVDRAGAAPAPGLGTPGYMPPEQAAGRRLDQRSDLFALGRIVLEWLAPLPDDDPAVRGLRAAGRQMSRPRRWRRPASADAVARLLREAVD